MHKERKRKWTDEKILEEIRNHSQRLGRTPRTGDVPEYLVIVATKQFHSWIEALEKALGRRAHYHHWTEEDLLDELRFLHERKQGFLTWDDLKSVRGQILPQLKKRFDSLNTALERALGKSPRTTILEALCALTPERSGCTEASTQEIAAWVQQHGLPMSVKKVSNHLDDFRREGYVAGGRIDRVALWSVTPRGKKFIAEFSAKGGRVSVAKVHHEDLKVEESRFTEEEKDQMARQMAYEMIHSPRRKG